MSNTTTDQHCEEIGFSYDIYGYLYDKSCLYQSNPVDGVCPVKVVNSFLDTCIGQLRLEAQVLTFLSIFTMVMIQQIGGIPIPAKSNKIGCLFWFCWMLSVFAQIFILAFALIVSCIGYFQFTQEFESCAVNWTSQIHNVPIINVFLLFSITVQPFILVPSFLISIYYITFAEGVKVLFGAQGIKKRFSHKWTKHLSLWYYFATVKYYVKTYVLGFKNVSSVTDGITQTDPYSRMMVTHNQNIPIHDYLNEVLFIIYQIYSIPLFSIILFVPFVLLLLPLVITIISIEGLFLLFIKDIVIGSLKSKKKKLCPRKLHGILEETISSLWWCDSNLNSTYFIAVFGANYFLVWLWGVWFGIFVFGGHSSSTNMTFLRKIYHFYYGCFADLAHFQLPTSINFDLSFLFSSTFYEDLGREIVNVTTEATTISCIKVSKGLMTLNFMASLLKTIVSYGNWVFAAYQGTFYPISIAQLAQLELDHAKNPDKPIEDVWEEAILSELRKEQGDSDDEEGERGGGAMSIIHRSSQNADGVTLKTPVTAC